MAVQVMLFVLALLVRTAFTHSFTCDTTCLPSTTVEVETSPIAVNATLAVDGTLDITILVNVSNYPQQLIDVYFLWENSYPCRTFSAPFWQTGAQRLYYPLIFDMQLNNPNLAFGLGFYTTKRLAGLGTRRNTDTYKTDFVFQPVAPLIPFASFIDSNMIPETWADSRAASNISSGLEALLDLLLEGDSNPHIKFRAGSRRVIIQAACSQVGVAGDVAPRLLMTSPVELPANVPFPPPNLYNGFLDNTCKITGNVCTDACGVITSTADPNVLPDATCGGCGLRSGVVSSLNITQFNYGSCTDYPSVAGFISTVKHNVSTPYEFIAFVPNITIGGAHTDYSGNSNSAFFQTLIDAVFVAPGVRSYVINSTLDLASYIQNAYPVSIVPPTVQIVPIVPSTGLPGDFDGLSPLVSGMTCNLTLCVYTVTLNYTDGGNGTFEVVFNGNPDTAVIINVENCQRPTQSRSGSHHSKSKTSSHNSKSGSNSHHVKTHSASHHSPSKSKSHHSKSKSTSHHSKSRSQSHHSHSKSTSKHSRSKSKSHHSHSKSASHHSKSKSQSHHSHSKSASHHSKSHSKSHHSHSKSASHHSKSKSQSHHSRSKSASHHSKSHSKSHHSHSHSKSASHHSPSKSQSHHLKSHSISHHSHSKSKSHHSSSHSKSHHSLSKSASHHSRSHSQSHHSRSASHHSRSHSKSHHSHSKSASHHSKSRSKSHHSQSHSKSHHSHSDSQSHHLKSHSISHHSHSQSKSTSHHSKSNSKSHHSRSPSLSESHQSRSTSHHTASQQSLSKSAKHPASRRGNHTGPSPSLTTTDIITISTVVPFAVLIACCCCCIPLIFDEDDDDDERRRRRRRRLF